MTKIIFGLRIINEIKIKAAKRLWGQNICFANRIFFFPAKKPNIVKKLIKVVEKFRQRKKKALTQNFCE